jgi:hypothetical protein
LPFIICLRGKEDPARGRDPGNRERAGWPSLQPLPGKDFLHAAKKGLDKTVQLTKIEDQPGKMGKRLHSRRTYSPKTEAIMEIGYRVA